MKFGRILVLSLATLLVAVPAVHAQDDMGDMTTKRPAKRGQTAEEENNDPTRSGPLFGLGATYAADNFDSVGMRNDGSGGLNAHFGYRFNKYLATEMEIEKYVSFDGNDHTATSNNRVGHVTGWAIGLNERFYPIGGRFQPFLLGGVNYLKMKTTDSRKVSYPKTDDGVGLRFGAGLDVYVTNRFLVTTDVSYMLSVGDVRDYDLIAISLGIAFRP